MKKGSTTFKKRNRHLNRKARAGSKGDVVSHRSKKHHSRNHPYSEANLSPSR